MTEQPTGVIPDLSFRDYLADPGYGNSDLQAFKKGPPALVQWRRNNREDTPSTIIGSAAHCQILTPDLFAQDWIVKPEGMKFTTKEGKAWREEHRAAGARDDQFLSWVDATKIDHIRSAFGDKDAAREALDGAAMVEASVFWTCKQSGLRRKCRPDFFGLGSVFDLKISIHATKGLEALIWQAHREGWVHQLAGCRQGLREAGYDIADGRLIVIAPTEPHGLRTWLLRYDENELDICQLDNENLARDLKPFHDDDVWPGTPEQWIDCKLPADHLMADVEGAEVVEEEGDHA